MIKYELWKYGLLYKAVYCVHCLNRTESTQTSVWNHLYTHFLVQERNSQRWPPKASELPTDSWSTFSSLVGWKESVFHGKQNKRGTYSLSYFLCFMLLLNVQNFVLSRYYQFNVFNVLSQCHKCVVAQCHNPFSLSFFHQVGLFFL